MLRSAELFKDEVIQGISTSIQSLLRFQSEKQDGGSFTGITRDNLYFKNLTNFLDFGLSFGLINPKKSYWPCMKLLAHPSIISMVETHKDASSELMKSHLWLFLSLLEDSLASYLGLCRDNAAVVNKFYKDTALLRDEEQLEVLKMLLLGLNSVNFNLEYSSPYVDFGRQNMAKPGDLRSSSYVHVRSPELSIVSTTIQPQSFDGTHDRAGIAVRKDDARSSPVESHLTHQDFTNGIRRIACEKLPVKQVTDSDDLVMRVNKPTRRRKKEHRAQGDNEHARRLTPSIASETESLADDHYIPDPFDWPGSSAAINSGGEATIPTEIASPAATELKEGRYGAFLQSYAGTSPSQLHQLREPSPIPTEDSIDGRAGSSKDAEGMYHMTYVSDDEENDRQRSASLDSFDRFCRKRSRGSSCDSEDLDVINAVASIDNVDGMPDRDEARSPENDLSLHTSALELSPTGNRMSPRGIQKILNARLDTQTGILLPSLPRRPSLLEAKRLHPDPHVEQNTILLLSLEVYQFPEEQFNKMFGVFVGHLFGFTLKLNLMLTDQALYFLVADVRKECGYRIEEWMPYDSINQIQAGFGYQDVIIKSDAGLYHVWTGDEVLTRLIIVSLKCELTVGAGAEESLFTMNAIYNSDLECVMKDWLILLEDEEEPDLLHFALIHYYGFSDGPASPHVVKSGFLQCKQTYLGVMSNWESRFFVLRGSRLYVYSSKGDHDLQQVIDLRTKCGGCVHVQTRDLPHTFKIVRPDGTTPLMFLAAAEEEDMSDWITSICHVFADVKSGARFSGQPGTECVHPCGMMMTHSKLFMILQESKSGRLSLNYTCLIKDIIQVYVDNENRSFCALNVDYSSEIADSESKRILILKFASEFELGKFEQKLFACWQVLYQVPLQFVLLSEGKLKMRIMAALVSECPLDAEGMKMMTVGHALQMS